VDRVAADKEFGYVREDIELYKKRQADSQFHLMSGRGSKSRMRTRLARRRGIRSV